MLHLYEEEELSKGLRHRVEHQLELPLRLQGVSSPRHYEWVLVFLENRLLDKIREKGRCAYPERLPDEQLRLGV